jgi:hypothetical protein
VARISRLLEASRRAFWARFYALAGRILSQISTAFFVRQGSSE